MGLKHQVRYRLWGTVAGALLGLGAPAGAFVLRVMQTGGWTEVAMRQEISDHSFFYFYALYLTPFFFGALGFVLGLLSDHLSDRAQVLNKTLTSVRDLANHDDLTGLYNHRHLFGELSKEIERARRHGQSLCGLMIDVDNFKEINDRYGHLAGDVVLRECGEIMKHHLRRIDVLGRYGGDEFLAILPATSAERAEAVAERLRLAISEHLFIVLKEPVQLSVSIGLWELDKTYVVTPEGFIDRADRALFAAKHTGRNRVCKFIQETEAVASFRPTRSGDTELED